jgi:hypothetical protein
MQGPNVARVEAEVEQQVDLQHLDKALDMRVQVSVGDHVRPRLALVAYWLRESTSALRKALFDLLPERQHYSSDVRQ